MRKIFLSLMMVCAVCSESLAASEDMSVYVRQDVFDAKMEMILTRIEGKIDVLSERIDGLDKKIDGVEKSLSEKIDGVDKKLSEKIDAVDKKIDSVEKSLSEKIDDVDKKLSEKIDGVDQKLSAQIDGVSQTLSARINGLDKRIEDTHNFLYLILVLFWVVFLVPFVSRFWELRIERRTPPVTLEDVKRLIAEAIAENSAKIRG